MASPFPGMDPYLESPAFWPDFHATFINCWREAIADRLPDDYEARIDERVTLVDSSFEPEQALHRIKAILPDVAITRGDAGPVSSPGTTTGLLEPVAIPLVLEPDEVRETNIEIRHRPDRTLVAVLELLSPTNKTGLGRSEYLKKRGALLQQPVHLVELDLLVGGDRLPAARPMPPGDYFYLVARSDKRPWASVYPWKVRDRLPRVPIPLRAPDADITVDLADVFATTYERGRYFRSLGYGEAPSAPLDLTDREWAVQLAAAAVS